jgi:DNA replication protein DnaC
VRARKIHPLGEEEPEEVTRAMRASLLVLDDLGAEPLDTVIFEVLDQRYSRGLPTIVTSGLTPSAIRERYGDAAWRRLSERGVVLEEWRA